MQNNIIETNKDTSTYDVQQRTFIKKPEPKVCPTCGQLMPSEVVPLRNEMAYYISGEDGANPIVVSRNEDVIEIKGVKMYKARKENGKWVSDFVPKKATATVTLQQQIKK